MESLHLTPSLLATGAILTLIAVLLELRRFRYSRSSFPGPPGRPVIRNLLDTPTRDGHLKYTEWSKVYGPIFQLKVLSKTIIVINSHAIAVDLLEKRGAIYSNRPPLYMHDMSGWQWNAAHMPHNDQWRARRRLVHQTFHINKVPQFYPLIRRTTLEYARSLLATPDNFRHHIRRSAAANAISAIYGLDVAIEPGEDPYVEIGERAMQSLDNLVIPGKNSLDVFPFLRHLPEWLPGTTFYARARELRQYPDAMLNVPYARFKDDLTKGAGRMSMMKQCLELVNPVSDVDEVTVKEAGAIAYLGGADTSVGSLTNFVRAMIIWPEVQHKAQEELDRVVGRERLPDFSDYASLPYIEAIIRETYRKWPVTPLGVPHALEEDDIYQGKIIKKGTTLLANQWAIFHDEATFPNADMFNPERFMKESRIDDSVPDPRRTFFGYGRRICPGKHFADASIYLMVATTLHCFRIDKHIENGEEMTPTEELVTGLTSLPVPFPCKIAPRFEKVAAMVNDAFEFREE